MEKLYQSNENSRTIEEKRVVERLEVFGDNRSAKILTLLVWKGLKPAAGFHIDDIFALDMKDNSLLYQKSEKLFSDLGIFYKRVVSEAEGEIRQNDILVPSVVYCHNYYIAKNETDLEYVVNNFGKKETKEVTKRLGQIFGYPQTAIDAWLAEDRSATILNEKIEKPELLLRNEMAFKNFRLSKDNYEEELKVVKKWADEIKRLDPQTYNKRVDTYKYFLDKK